MTLCARCNGITINTHQYTHQQSFANLLVSAESCQLCKLLARVLEREGCRKSAESYQGHKDGKYGYVNDTSITISVGQNELQDFESPIPPYRLLLTCGPLLREGHYHLENQDVASKGYALAIYADEGTPAAEVIPTRPIAAESNSDATYQMIRDWVSTCAEEHKECQIAGLEDKAPARVLRAHGARDLSLEEDVHLPTRLLKVANEAQVGHIRLCKTEGLKGCYAALSHCWGNSEPFITTEANLDARLKNIDYAELPKTFQDAVTITRRVGLKYLWIDSLCIIQHDRDDWERESAAMGQVYRNAYFTIAASSSVDGNGGCFHHRTPSDAHAIALPFFSADDCIAGHWYVYDHSDNQTTSVIQSPLQQRGWTLQERYLSRRMIHFAKDQLYFECKHSFKFETCRPEYRHSQDYLGNSNMYFMATITDFPILLRSLVARQWCAVVENYTTRKLTNEEDKLPALSGLASHLTRLTHMAYVAGLWKDTMFTSQLLWRVLPYNDGRFNWRPKTARAPSWSWASMEGPLLFPNSWLKPLEPRHTRIVLDDVEVSVEPLGKDMHGQVRSGTLRVTGWVLPIQHLSNGFNGELLDCQQFAAWVGRVRFYNLPNIPLIEYNFVRAPDRSFFGAAAFDERVEELDVTTALLVQQQEGAEEFKQNGHVNSFFVLFLTPICHSDVRCKWYRRVGMGHLVMSQMLGLGISDKRRISIV